MAGLRDRRTAFAHLGGLAIGAWTAAEASEPLAWLGVALLLFCGLSLLRRARELSIPSWLARIGPPLLVCLLVLWVTRDLLWGGAPLSRDHPVHLYKTWILVHDLIPSGRLFGWSERWYAGFPANEGYPLLPYLWSAAAHLGTFGLVDLERSYALGQVALWLLLSLSAYLWGRRLGGPSAGVAAAIFVLLDPGAYRGGGREGGWTYHMQLGVWPQALAIGFALLSGLAVAEGLRRGGPLRRWIALASILGAASLLAHPLGLVPLLGLHGALVAGRLLSPRSEPMVLRSGGAALGSLAVAALLSGFWLAQFLGNRSSFRSSPGSWRDLDDLAAGLLRGELFLDGWALPGVLALVGGLLLARRRLPEDLAVLGLALLSVTVASPHLLGTLFGADLPGPLRALQYDRLAIHAKPLLFVMAGVAVAAVARGLGRGLESLARPADAAWSAEDGGKAPARWRGRASTAVLCVIAAPLALWAARQAESFLPEVGQIPTVATSPDRQHMDDLAAWLAAEAREEAGPVRLGLRHGPGGPRVLEDLFVVAARAEMSVHHFSGTPADTFRHRSHHEGADELQALNVRWVVSRGPLEREDLRPVAAFGPFHVQEVTGYRPERMTLLGEGSAEVLEHGDEVVRLALRGVGAGTRVVLHRSPHPRWRASLDGSPLEVLPFPRRDGATFIAISVPSDGELLLEYGALPADVPGLWLSALGLLAVLGLLLPLRRRAGSDVSRARGPAPRWARSYGVALGVAGAIALVGVVRAATTERASPERDLVREVAIARFSPELRPPCRTHGICRVAAVPPLVVARGHRGAVTPCIRLTAPTAGRYRLTFPTGRAGPSLEGAWYWTPGPRAALEVRPEPLPVAAPTARLFVGDAGRELPAGRRGRWRPFELEGTADPEEIALELDSEAPARIEACFQLTIP